MHTHLQYTTGLAVDLFWHLATPLAQEGGELLLLLPRQRVHAARGVRHGRRGRHAAPVGGAQAPRLMARAFPVRVLGSNTRRRVQDLGLGPMGTSKRPGTDSLLPSFP